MDLSSEDKRHINALMNPNLLEFLVIPPRLWVEKTVVLHNGNGVCITKGLVRNLHSNAIVGLSCPLSDSQVFA